MSSYPTGWPGQHPNSGWPQPQRRGKASHAAEKTASNPGKFHWGDLFALIVYIGGFVLGAMLLVFSIPGVTEFGAQAYGHDPMSFDEVLSQNPMPGWFLMYSNVVLYGITGIIMLAVSWRPFVQSFRWFASWWWVKVLLLPVIWLATLMLTSLFMVLSGQDPDVSANQEAVEQAAGESSLIISILVMGLLGPFVEEYIFRHLLIGKLSRWIPTWVTAPVSIIAFTLLHFIGDTNMSIASVLPYVSMAIAFTAVYLLSKKSFAYAWLSPAFNNVVSVVLLHVTTMETALLTF
ncbi:MAG: CPBP family intramembrane metalloprotease [Yaniella sp.]|nr:CPBP family intramembrane metalloprotease [Yaniella sp.]